MRLAIKRWSSRLDIVANIANVPLGSVLTFAFLRTYDSDGTVRYQSS